MFFSDENFILCTQEKYKVYISFIIYSFGTEKLPTNFLDILTEELKLNNEWPSDLFEELVENFNKTTHDNTDTLSTREIKYLMIKSAKAENYLEVAKYKDTINKNHIEL